MPKVYQLRRTGHICHKNSQDTNNTWREAKKNNVFFWSVTEMISNQKSSKTEIMIMITISVVATAAAYQQQNWEEGEFTERKPTKSWALCDYACIIALIITLLLSGCENGSVDWMWLVGCWTEKLSFLRAGRLSVLGLNRVGVQNWSKSFSIMN